MLGFCFLLFGSGLRRLLGFDSGSGAYNLGVGIVCDRLDRGVIVVFVLIVFGCRSIITAGTATAATAAAFFGAVISGSCGSSGCGCFLLR